MTPLPICWNCYKHINIVFKTELIFFFYEDFVFGPNTHRIINNKKKSLTLSEFSFPRNCNDQRLRKAPFCMRLCFLSAFVGSQTVLVPGWCHFSPTSLPSFPQASERISVSAWWRWKLYDATEANDRPSLRLHIRAQTDWFAWRFCQRRKRGGEVWYHRQPIKRGEKY